ncbi:MAG TPA: tetratricopeptide repeat protein [Methylomirabilota bacterium]|jgi:tetratricopeptide (TPR) repeat protein|nr:tetratricopeptide repeat protein [Methylomirabilota bacterium]
MMGGALLLLAVLAATAGEQAGLLERLRAGGPAERRAAAERLAEVGDDGAAADLVQALRDADPDVRGEAQDALWAIWHRSGDPAIDALLAQGIALMDSRRLPESVEVFSDVIAKAPAFAEGWNKRATAYYLMGELDRSLADCEEVVRRNPVHFGALSGFGLIYLQKEDLPRAAEYFEKALAVNPNLAQVEAVLERIREILRQRRQQSI